MLLSQEVLRDDLKGLRNALESVLEEHGVEDMGIALLLTQIVAVGVQADRWNPPDTFGTHVNGTEAVRNAIFRVNAIVSHVKD